MTRPQRYLFRMIAFLVVVAGVLALLLPTLIGAFNANPLLNGLILSVLAVGIVDAFRQVVILYPEVRWIERFRDDDTQMPSASPPKYIAPMATMLAERRGRLSLSPTSMRTLLDGIASRLDEARDISRYFIGLLIFLGLLGTFWGLLQTVNSVSGVIANLTVGSSDLNSVFDDLKSGLQAPLSGMGTAFSSSLFGLAGSLILGFLDLQASQAQHRFFNDLEEWLSGLTRLSSGIGIGEGEGSVPAYIQALLEQTADSLEELQRTLARGEESRMSTGDSLNKLTDRLSTLTDQMHTEQALMVRLAENQRDLAPVLSRLAEAASGGFGMDDATRNHIRNLDVYLTRLVDEVSSGRAESVRDIRSEIKLLARTIAALAEEER
jgi:hypothetical protein